MEILLVFLGLMILIAAFTHGGRQSASESIKEGVSESAEVARDNWKMVVVVFLIVSAAFYFGYLK